jgi:HAE1 family hydrophobic/amphiphilic exporter-1
LKDVANIEFQLDVRYLLNLNGKPSARLIKQSYGSNASQVIKGRKSKISRNQNLIPQGVDYELVMMLLNF